MARLRFLVRSLARSAPLMLAFALGAGQAAAQSEFPNRRIHILVPYPAGGIVDIVTRIVADRLSEIWRQPFVIEAKPGAGGNIAWDQAARAEPDGYTVVFVGPALMSSPRMYPNLRWSEKSFTPVGAVAWAPSVLMVHPSLPADTVTHSLRMRANVPAPSTGRTPASAPASISTAPSSSMRRSSTCWRSPMWGSRPPSWT